MTRQVTVQPPAPAPGFWEDARASLSGLPGGSGLNIAYEAVDRHTTGPFAGRVALRCLAESGPPHELTYRELAERSSRFASAMASLGVGSGERVFVLTGRIPELYIAVLGGLKLGVVVCTLFAAFGPETIAQRLRLGFGRVLVTTPELYDRKVAASRAKLPDLRQVLLTGDPTECLQRPETGSLTTALDEAAAEFPIAPTRAEDPALLHFTSGTTGKPKGAVHVHGAIVGHVATARLVLDLRAEDVYWCTADPGWVTGTSFGIVAPLVIGATSIVDEAEFDVHRWYRTIDEQQVTVWYTAPTTIRRLMRAGDQAAEAHDLSSLRAVASVGEPLNPEAMVWGQRVLHRTIRDNWWQTETGAIAIANYGDAPVRPGSMGRPVPGMTAAVLVRGECHGQDPFRGRHGCCRDRHLVRRPSRQRRPSRRALPNRHRRTPHPTGGPMNEAQVRELVQTVLDGVAPGAGISGLGPDDDLRRTLDLDSLDFLNFVVEIDNRTGVQTSESDYPKLTTLSGCVDYLSGHPAPA